MFSVCFPKKAQTNTKFCSVKTYLVILFYYEQIKFKNFLTQVLSFERNSEMDSKKYFSVVSKSYMFLRVVFVLFLTEEA